MSFISIAGKLVKGVVKVGKKVGGAAVDAIKRGIAKRKEKKAAKLTADPVSQYTNDLVDGSAKYYRELVNQQKDKMRAVDEKIRFVKKLVAQGMPEAEARLKVGLKDSDLQIPTTAWLNAEPETEPEPEPFKATAVRQGCMALTFIIIGAGSLMASLFLFLLTKIF